MNRIFEKVKIKVSFTKPSNRVTLSSGDELPTLMGKIKKYLEDIKSVAFSGKFGDLTTESADAGHQGKLGLTKLYSWDYCDTNSDTMCKISDGSLTVGAAWSMYLDLQDSINSNSGSSGNTTSNNKDSRLDELFAKTGEGVWTTKTDIIPATTEKQNIGNTGKRWESGHFKNIDATTIYAGNKVSSESFTGYYASLGLNNENPSDYCNGIAMFASGSDFGFSAGIGLCGQDMYGKTIANQVVIGHYNSSMTAGTGGTTGTAFIIGNGIGIYDDNNAFIVDYDGSAYSRRTLLTGADYAEYMEWKDKNSNNEDRVGRFVTLVEDKIAIANSGDYIVGIISGNASVIGNDDFHEWSGRFLKDNFGRLILGDVEIINEDSGEIKILHNQPQNNPEYDKSLTYVPRNARPEWDTVGMLGVLKVIDDGTCVADGWCKVSENGIATVATIEENSFLNPIFKVMKRTSDDVIEIFFK